MEQHSHRVVGRIIAVMSPTVPDTKGYNLTHEDTARENGTVKIKDLKG